MKKTLIGGVLILIIFLCAYVFLNQKSEEENLTNVTGNPEVLDYNDSFMSFEYPASWQKTDSNGAHRFFNTGYDELSEDGSVRDSIQNLTYFISPDAIHTDQDTFSLDFGYVFLSQVTSHPKNDPSTDFNTRLTLAERAVKDHEAVYEVIEIDGIKTILITSSEGDALTASLYENGNHYYFQLTSSDKTAKTTWDLMKSILQTVELE